MKSEPLFAWWQELNIKTKQTKKHCDYGGGDNRRPDNNWTEKHRLNTHKGD